jgi:hypothetical protein
LYCSEFLQGLEESINHVNSGKTKEVTSLEDFTVYQGYQKIARISSGRIVYHCAAASKIKDN